MDDIAEIQQAILRLQGSWRSIQFSCGAQSDEIHTLNKKTYLSADEGMEAITILHSSQSRKIWEHGLLTCYLPPLPLLSFRVFNTSTCQKNLASLFKRPMYGRATSFFKQLVVSINEGTPIAGWFMEKTWKKPSRNGWWLGVALFRNTQLNVLNAESAALAIAVLRIQNAAIAQRSNGCHCGKHLVWWRQRQNGGSPNGSSLYLHNTNQTSYQIMDAIIK